MYTKVCTLGSRYFEKLTRDVEKLTSSIGSSKLIYPQISFIYLI